MSPQSIESMSPPPTAHETFSLCEYIDNTATHCFINLDLDMGILNMIVIPKINAKWDGVAYALHYSYIPYSGKLLQKEIFASASILLSGEIFAIFEYYIHTKIHRSYMDPKMCASFSISNCKICKIKTHNKFPLYIYTVQN